MATRLHKISALFKKYFTHVLSFLGGVVTLWGFSITLNNTIPSINLESIVISSGKMSAIFENQNASSLDNFHAEFYVYLDDKTIHIPRQEMQALVGSGGRRIIDFPYYDEKPNKIIACVSYQGAYITDSVWQKVELSSLYNDPVSAEYNIFTFNGETTKLGHNYMFNAKCGMEGSL